MIIDVLKIGVEKIHVTGNLANKQRLYVVVSRHKWDILCTYKSVYKY